MGWYSAIVRGAFFTLPPEAAHRAAGALLSLPFPWERIGGAQEDDRLHVTLAGIPLRNPIGLAAGFDKGCRHLDALGRLGFGYVVGGTVTRRPRIGNPRPRVVRYPKQRAMTNSMGLPNPGAHVVRRTLSSMPRTAPRLVSLADEDPADAAWTCELLDPLVDAFELNASSPNAGWRHEGHRVVEVARGLLDVTARPVFVKLPPFRSEGERGEVLGLAEAVLGEGVAGLTCSNTSPMEERRLATGRGGLSGAPLGAATVGIVREVRRAVGEGIPINASGGVFGTDGALACLAAGATTVQLFTALLYEGPGLVGQLTRELASAMRERGTDVAALSTR